MATFGRVNEILEDTSAEFAYHDRYTVMDADGNDIGVSMLIQYYGDVWTRALDRLCHRLNGYLFSIRHEGHEYGVYRRLATHTAKRTTHLRLVTGE